MCKIKPRIRISKSKLYNAPKKNSPKNDKSQSIRNTVTISLSGLGKMRISQRMRTKTKISYKPTALLPIYNKGIFIIEKAGILTTPRIQRRIRMSKR